MTRRCSQTIWPSRQRHDPGRLEGLPVGWQRMPDSIAVALQMHYAGWGDPFRIFDKPVERPGNGHESQRFFGPDVGNSAAHLTMWGLCPELLAAKLKPVVQVFQRWKAYDRLKETMTGILNILLDLSLLPAGRRIAETRVRSHSGWPLPKKRTLTSRSFPRPILSVVVRVLS